MDFEKPPTQHYTISQSNLEVHLITAVHADLCDFLPDTAKSVDNLRSTLNSYGCRVWWHVTVDGPQPARHIVDLVSRHADSHTIANQHLGVSASRNLALSQAAQVAGDASWVFRLDGDDTVAPEGWVQLLLDKRFGSTPWHATNLVTGDNSRSAHWFDSVTLYEKCSVEQQWTSPMPFHPGNIVARLDLVLAAGGWPALRVNEDIQFCFTLNALEPGLALPYVTLHYRRWRNQVVAAENYVDAKKDSFAFIEAATNARRQRDGFTAITAPPPAPAVLYTKPSDITATQNTNTSQYLNPPQHNRQTYSRHTEAPDRVVAAVTTFVGEQVAEVSAQRIPSLSGQVTARFTTSSGLNYFVKWVPQASDTSDAHELFATAEKPLAAEISLAREAFNLQVVKAVVPTAHLVGFDTQRSVLITEWLDGPKVDFSHPDILHRCAVVLDAVTSFDVGLAHPRTTPRPGMSGAKDLDKVCSVFGDLGVELAECATLVLTLNKPVLGHADPHPDNWVLDSDTLCLVDFDHLGPVPSGWDRVFLSVFLAAPGPLPAGDLVDWVLQSTDRDTARIIAGALAFRFARGAVIPTPPGLPESAWSPYSRKHLPSALALYNSLNTPKR